MRSCLTPCQVGLPEVGVPGTLALSCGPALGLVSDSQNHLFPVSVLASPSFCTTWWRLLICPSCHHNFKTGNTVERQGRAAVFRVVSPHHGWTGVLPGSLRPGTAPSHSRGLGRVRGAGERGTAAVQVCVSGQNAYCTRVPCANYYFMW